MIGSGYANDDTHDRVAVILTRLARRKFPMACRCRRVFSRNHGGSRSDGVHCQREGECRESHNDKAATRHEKDSIEALPSIVAPVHSLFHVSNAQTSFQTPPDLGMRPIHTNVSKKNTQCVW
jgi:hypothetical protein